MQSYQEALAYLDDLNRFGWKPGLERIRRLLELLGNPEKAFPSIHVGGTNGKGSVTVTLSTLLKDQGLRVGQYISPEMFDVRERISIGGQWISEADLLMYVERIRQAVLIMEKDGEEGPTNFEVWTAMAFLWFRDAAVDLAVVEVGLGGAIDSTNVIDPLLSIITNVSIDHKDYLGETLKEIAQVKAGIIKDHRPIVTASVDPEVLEVIEKKARETGSPLYRFSLEFDGLEEGFEEGSSHFAFHCEGMELKVEYSLVGHHQVMNGAVALMAVSLLKEMGYPVDWIQAATSMKKVFWPGRMELLRIGNKRVLLDAAHNLDGALHLAWALKDIHRYRRLVLLVGILGDKERKKMIDLLGPLGDQVIITRPDNPRASDFADVAPWFSSYCKNVAVVEEVEEALLAGLASIEEEDLLCITGSIYLLKDIRKMLERMIGDEQRT